MFEKIISYIDIYTVLSFIFTYLICSINPAIEICKKKTGQDIRKLGSGNAGSANAMRVLRKITGDSCCNTRYCKSIRKLCDYFNNL